MLYFSMYHVQHIEAFLC